jgi:hypothetical protein
MSRVPHERLSGIGFDDVIKTIFSILSSRNTCWSSGVIVVPAFQGALWRKTGCPRTA